MKFLTLFFLFTLPFFAFSQANYHKGSVTISDSKTLTGYVNVREWSENPKYIEFKKDPADKTSQKFYPVNTRSAIIDGYDTYYSYWGRISMDHTQFPDLAIGKDTSSVIDTVFLKLITSGDNVILYSYTDAIKTRFFISEKHQPPHELQYQQYYEDETKTKSRTTNGFAGELSALIIKYANSPKLLAKTERLSYEMADIQDVVNGINGVAKVKSSKSYSRLYAGVGVNISNMNFNITSDPTKYSDDAVSIPQLSVGFDLFNNPDIQSLIFRAELSAGYTNAQFTGSSYDDRPHTFSFTRYDISVTPQVLVSLYNKDAFKLYIGGGLNFIYEVYSKNDLIIKDKTVGDLDYGPELLTNFVFNLPVQLSMVFNKRVELLFSSSTLRVSYSNDTSVSLKSRVYGAGLHYLF